jgi:hypothetical protein
LRERDKEKQAAAGKECFEGKLEARGFIPEGDEVEEESDESESESDEEKDVLDVMQERRFGTRRSERKRKEIERTGFFLGSNQVSFVHTGSEDSEANGMG